MANQTIYPYGTGGSLPSSIGIINDLVTGGADKALAAQQGVVLNEKINNILGGEQPYQLSWVTGNIRDNNGTLDTSYANKTTGFVKLLSSILVVHNISSYNLKVACYDSAQTYLGLIASGGIRPNTTATPSLREGTAYVRMTAWERPSDTDVQNISAGYYTEDTIVSLRAAIDELSGDRTFSNPVFQADRPDPCIINGEDGFFYLLGTGQLATRKMSRSTNLVDWENADVPFTQQAITACLSDLGVSSAMMWAPEIVKIGNKYNLYCSREANPMVVFQSNHPNFGYEYKGKIITTSNGLASDNIDACVRYDLDGTLWMFWGSTYGIYRQKLSADGLTLDANDTKVHVAGKLLSQDSSRATVFEGAYLYRKKGYWYLFVSAGSYSNYTYCLKVGRSTTLNGTFVDKEGNDMADGYATTILSSASGDTLYGPGHNGIIHTDRNNRTYMVYHSHYTGAASSSQRYICLQEMFWDEDGWPYFANNKPQFGGNIKPVL